MQTDPLDPYRRTPLDLPALVAAAGALLARCPAPADERVSALPDERTIRYYQTLGLVDRPNRYEGRVAQYGLRQLLQVVCIKLLQHQGLGLSAIQNSLAGASDLTMEAALRDGLGMAASPPPPVAQPLLAMELRPGITVLIDSAKISDPQAIFQAFTLALQGVPQ